MKKYCIKNYQVLIDEEHARCGVAISLDLYKIKIKNFLNILYQVDYHNKKITIFNNSFCIVLENCSQELLYFAFKTINLQVILGKNNKISSHFIASLE